MFGWIKSLFSMPQPSGPPQTIKSFGAQDPTINQEVVSADGYTLCIDNPQKGQTVRLFEFELPKVDQCMLTYRAHLKSEDLQGKAYLEMWVRVPGRGEFFSKGLHNTLSGTNDWASFEVPFYLKQGQNADLAKLNVVMEGPGRVWLKDIEILQTPLA